MTGDEYAAAVRKFRPGAMTLLVSAHWRVVLRVKQITLGAMVLLPLEPLDDFSSVSPEIAADFFRVTVQCQTVIRNSFAADRFNLVAAMMKDPFVHFHLVPRYEDVRTFAGTSWVDSDWPQLVTFRDVDTADSTHDLLLAELRSEFDQLAAT